MDYMDMIMNLFKGEDRKTQFAPYPKSEDYIQGEGDEGYVSGDFSVIMKSIFSGDEDGQRMYSDLVDSGNIGKIKELWEMGGMPGLSYSDKIKDPRHPASYSRDPSFHIEGKEWPDREWSGSGVINIHSGSGAHSSEKFDSFIAELSHAIGYNNPAMMKLGVREFKDEMGNILGKNPMEPTYDFLQSLDTFPAPESPSDSLAVWKNWWKSQPDSIRKSQDEHFMEGKARKSGYVTEGHSENITHNRIESAIKWWLYDSEVMPYDWYDEDNKK